MVPPRTLWSDDETFDLLDVIKLQNVSEALLLSDASSRTQHEAIYKSIAKELWLRGHIDKHADDVQLRWEKLQRCYHKAVRVDDWTIAGPFYEELHELLSEERKSRPDAVPTHREEAQTPKIIEEPNDGKSSETNDSQSQSSGSKGMVTRRKILKKIKTYRYKEDGAYYRQCRELNEFGATLYGRFSKNRDNKFNRLLDENSSNIFTQFMRMVDGKSVAKSTKRKAAAKDAANNHQNGDADCTYEEVVVTESKRM
uniref:Myb/SANT-like DNA-binding domain-containing protein n=1 Tax=Anopheles braziliensis TaxID=58242 RepID=A0A2M3ZJZ6_9DIPT